MRTVTSPCTWLRYRERPTSCGCSSKRELRPTRRAGASPGARDCRCALRHAGATPTRYANSSPTAPTRTAGRTTAPATPPCSGRPAAAATKPPVSSWARKPTLMQAAATVRPLMAAAEFGAAGIVRDLLHHGADAHRTDRQGRTALDIAGDWCGKDIETELRNQANIAPDDTYECLRSPPARRQRTDRVHRHRCGRGRRVLGEGDRPRRHRGPAAGVHVPVTVAVGRRGELITVEREFLENSPHPLDVASSGRPC